MYSTKQHINRTIEDNKYMLQEAMLFAGLTETDLALHLGVSLATISNWLNPQNSRQFPLALLTELPEKMRNFITDYINKKNREKPISGLDGSIIDEKLILTSLNGQLAMLRETEPTKVKNVCAEIRITLAKLEAELGK